MDTSIFLLFCELSSLMFNLTFPAVAKAMWLKTSQNKRLWTKLCALMKTEKQKENFNQFLNNYFFQISTLALSKYIKFGVKQ
jgi:hypothetical protein